ncbi:MAG TPA: hypothetical protein DDW65_03265 [Firmicutes bacterium]|jgi:hypothetical protein|nr:hypothetical protein [Bacillota bacterium]
MCRYSVRIIPKRCPDVPGISVRMRPKYAVLDQPSQTHFPDDTDKETEHEEFEAVKKHLRLVRRQLTG